MSSTVLRIAIPPPTLHAFRDAYLTAMIYPLTAVVNEVEALNYLYDRSRGIEYLEIRFQDESGLDKYVDALKQLNPRIDKNTLQTVFSDWEFHYDSVSHSYILRCAQRRFQRFVYGAKLVEVSRLFYSRDWKTFVREEEISRGTPRRRKGFLDVYLNSVIDYTVSRIRGIRIEEVGREILLVLSSVPTSKDQLNSLAAIFSELYAMPRNSIEVRDRLRRVLGTKLSAEYPDIATLYVKLRMIAALSRQGIDVSRSVFEFRFYDIEYRGRGRNVEYKYVYVGDSVSSSDVHMLSEAIASAALMLGVSSSSLRSALERVIEALAQLFENGMDSVAEKLIQPLRLVIDSVSRGAIDLEDLYRFLRVCELESRNLPQGIAQNLVGACASLV
ncbi:MAG: hypothetical protein GXO32_06435 [Crenarchaeota archaeon]|nr:hypothetical protein [Thermoproteota archaeon]